MGRGCVLLVTLAGCNWVLGLSPTQTGTADSGPVLIVPPDGTTACSGLPDFDRWHYAPHVVTGVPGVLHPTFLTPDRVVFMSQSHLWESGVDGGARRLTELELYDFDQITSPSSGGDSVMWFWRLGGVDAGIYYASRDDTGWHQARAELGLIAFQVQPGSVGFYNGTVRMVVAVQQTKAARSNLVELSSLDGLTWGQVGTLPFGDGTHDLYDPALSRDGCVLLFADYTSGGDLYAAARGPDGDFRAPVHLVTASTPAQAAQPAVDPTLAKLWFVNGGLMEATP